MIPFIGNIDIMYDQMQIINCNQDVDNVRLILLFDNIWWLSQYTCELQKFVNGIVWQLNIELLPHNIPLSDVYQKMSSNCIIRWRLLIEEFGPTFVHIKGERNVIADA